LLATATMLVLPVAAIAWLSPGLVTAADGPGVEGLLAFEAAAVTAPADPQAEEVALSAEDWAFTNHGNKAEDKAFKEQQKQEKAAFKAREKAFKECQKQQKKNFKKNGPPPSPATCLPP